MPRAATPMSVRFCTASTGQSDVTDKGETQAVSSPPETPAGCPVVVAKKPCKRCGHSYEDTRQHFPKGENTCRACVRTAATKRREKAAASRKAAMDKIEAQALDLYASLATSGGNNIPHSAEVLERIFQYFGGVAGFSAMLVKQYYDSPPGGTARNRLLETIVRLVSKNVEQGGAKKPLTLWTEDELEAELEQRFEQALTTYKGVTVDAKPQALEAPDTEGCSDDPDAEGGGTDAVPEGRDHVPPVGTEGEAAGGVEAVSPDADPAADARVHGKRSPRDRR